MYDQAGIRRILPHRHPMLLLDRVDEITFFERLVAVKAITSSEPCYRAVPESPSATAFAYPRSLIVESFCQSGAFLWLASIAEAGRESSGSLVLATCKDVVFHQHAFPGDVLRHEVRLTKVVGDNALLTGQTWIGDRLAVQVGTVGAAVRPTQLLARD